MPGWLVFVVMASRGVSDCGRVLLNACAPLRSESSAVLEGLLRALCPLLDLAKPPEAYSYPLPLASYALLR